MTEKMIASTPGDEGSSDQQDRSTEPRASGRSGGAGRGLREQLVEDQFTREHSAGEHRGCHYDRLGQPRGPADSARGGVADEGVPADRSEREVHVRRLGRAARPTSSRALPPTCSRQPAPSSPRSCIAKGLVEKPVEFATNTLVLIVPNGNPAHITSVERHHQARRKARDLQRDGPVR